MIEAIGWWLITMVIGVAAFSIIFWLLPGLTDRGYAFSKTLGLLLLAYLLWIGGTAHVIPNARLAIVVLLCALAVGAALIVYQRAEELASFLRQRWSYILSVEALFILSFVTALWLRSFVAGIHDIEKPMDFTMLNATVRTEYFPPDDPWFAGETLNYYYFGYVIYNVPIQLLGVASSVGYNLALASTLALAAVGIFGLVFNLVARSSQGPGFRLPGLTTGGLSLADAVRSLPGAVRGLSPLVAGLLAVVFLLVMGNLMGVLEMLTVHGVGEPSDYSWLKIAGLDEPRETNTWYPTEHFWWIRAITYFTWSEFPFFSFLLGDLHPHVLAMPFSLLAAGIALAVLLGDGSEVREFWRQPGRLALTGLIMGGLGFVLTWNFPVALFFLAVVCVLKVRRMDGRFEPRSLLYAGGYIVAVAMVALIAFAPYYFTVSNPTELAFSEGPAVRAIHLFIFWGTFMVITFAFALFALLRHPEGWRIRPQHLAIAVVISLLPLALWSVGHLLKSGFTGDLPARLYGWPSVAITNALLFLVVLAGLRYLLTDAAGRDRTSLIFALTCSAAGVFLILAPDLFVVLDPLDLRVNTVIKSWYQAWLFLAIGSAYAVYWIAAGWRPRLEAQAAFSYAAAGRYAALGVITLLVAAGMIYPVIASYARTNDFDGYQTIDGLSFLARGNPDEYAAIRWLDENADGDAVVLEAFGGDYTEAGRVSSRTGVPTIIAWPGHQQQWRGPSEEYGLRSGDIEQAYNTPFPDGGARILERYDVKYVYVGALERQTYREDGIAKFAEFMDVAYENATVTIYEIRPDSDAAASR